jgi:septum formation protein
VTPRARIVLASASPRRREILSQLGIAFDVIVADVDETQHADEDPVSYVLRLSETKARAVLPRLSAEQPTFVLGADTTVVMDQQVLGKPSDLADSVRMLQMLSGREHEVHTAVTVIAAPAAIVHSVVKTTRVIFRELSAPVVRAYAQSGEGADKAGSYAIQGLGAGLVTEIHGSYSNVVGLPAAETIALLQVVGALASWPASSP